MAKKTTGKTTTPSVNYGHVNPTGQGLVPPRQELNISIAPADTTPPSPPAKKPWRD
jgi:hypothetical protein